MPYIPHTPKDVELMLDAMGVDSIETLFDEIPDQLRCSPLQEIPDGISEMELNQHLEKRRKNIQNGHCFIGAGAYEHHIPACVWELASRGEFLTAYTPYQAEASQGTLQLLYEFQTIMASLTGMEVSNASLYDGGSSLAEAVLMAVRVNKKSRARRVLMLGAVHPHYFETTTTLVENQAVELVNIPYEPTLGKVSTERLKAYDDEDVTAIVIQHPNFFGGLEDVDALCRWAHQKGALVIACVNPVAMGLIKPPGEWGDSGADIVCGEGQPLGVPLASGGPYFGFLTTRLAFVRQLPGRLVGRTVDLDGKEGFSLTLQAREQHIRRSKATSNICTNQGLLVTAATIYASLLGYKGLNAVANSCHINTGKLLRGVLAIPGVERTFSSDYFHEFVVRLPKDCDEVVRRMHQNGFDCGLSLKPYFPELGDSLLVCVTETKAESTIAEYVDVLREVLGEIE